jgi:hypothetical protein
MVKTRRQRRLEAESVQVALDVNGSTSEMVRGVRHTAAELSPARELTAIGFYRNPVLASLACLTTSCQRLPSNMSGRARDCLKSSLWCASDGGTL